MKTIFKPSKQPNWIAPMLATLVYKPFSDPAWLFERKLDGMRCILHKSGDQVTIWSRNKKNQNKVFPELVQALKKYRSNFILDCEVVCLAGTKTDFEKLQERMHVQNPSTELLRKFPVVAYVFDIMYLNDFDLTNFPLLVRKKILKENFKFSKPFKYLSDRKKNGLQYFEYAVSKGWEGVVAKLSDSKYIQKRSKEWLKFKCDFAQEFVIGGYTQPRGHRVKFGALLLGYYKNGTLRYAGKVGTGFTVDMLLQLHKRMQGLEVKKSPFVDYADQTENIKWLKPKLVAQLGFTEWTSTGRLRHPRYLGLRNDKISSAVRREGK